MKNKLTNLLPAIYLAQGESQGILNTQFTNIGTLFGASGTSPAGSETVGTLIFSVVSILLLVAGGIATVFIIVGGFQYVLSRGNEEASETAKKTLQSAVLGLVIILLSFAMVRIIAGVLLQGTSGLF